MQTNRAFGAPGSTRGVHQGAHIVLAYRLKLPCAIGARYQHFIVSPSGGPCARIRLPQRDEVCAGNGQAAAQRIHQRQKLCARQHGAYLRVLDDVLDLGRTQAKVKRHHHQAGPRHGDIDLHPLNTVIGQHCHTVAFDQAQTR